MLIKEEMDFLIGSGLVPENTRSLVVGGNNLPFSRFRK